METIRYSSDDSKIWGLGPGLPGLMDHSEILDFISLSRW